MKPKALYSLRFNGGNFTIKKFDEDIELMSEYTVTIGPRGNLTCDCPQAYNRKRRCRHLDMIEGRFLPSGHIGDGYLLCFETGEFTEPPL